MRKILEMAIGAALACCALTIIDLVTSSEVNLLRNIAVAALIVILQWIVGYFMNKRSQNKASKK